MRLLARLLTRSHATMGHGLEQPAMLDTPASLILAPSSGAANPPQSRQAAGGYLPADTALRRLLVCFAIWEWSARVLIFATQSGSAA